MEVCPISPNKVDEHVVRLNAIFTILILIAGYWFTPLWWFLIIDFLARAYSVKFSLLARFNRFTLNTLNIKPEPTNAGPKKFAAKIGLLMAVLLTAFAFLNFQIGVYVILGFFLIAASLEAFFNYCLGCQVYSILVNLGLIKAK